MKNVLTLFVVLFSCLLLFAGCNFSGDVASLKSYSVSCDKGRDCAVTNSEGNTSVIVEPEVDSYLIEGDFILGHSTQQVLTPIPGLPEPFSNQRPGYFIVDTRKNTWDVGLDESEWHAKLKSIGIENPKLRDIIAVPSGTVQRSKR